MTFRKTFVAVAAVAALAFAAAGAAFAQSAEQKALVDRAKAEGTVGEQADGYLGFRVASTDAGLQAAVRVTNDGRRAAYARAAAETGVSADVAAARAFETIVQPRISSGQWWRNASGQWVRR
jgi:uncharacterized protein YdbL (DUF1318 family)